MSADEYWHGDPWFARGYRDAQNIITERKNHEAWLHGFYVYDALSVALVNALSKKGAKQEKYMEPVRITPMTPIEKQQQAAKDHDRIMADRQKVIAQLTASKLKFDAKKKEAANGNDRPTTN